MQMLDMAAWLFPHLDNITPLVAIVKVAIRIWGAIPAMVYALALALR